MKKVPIFAFIRLIKKIGIHSEFTTTQIFVNKKNRQKTDGLIYINGKRISLSVNNAK